MSSLPRPIIYLEYIYRLHKRINEDETQYAQKEHSSEQYIVQRKLDDLH